MCVLQLFIVQLGGIAVMYTLHLTDLCRTMKYSQYRQVSLYSTDTSILSIWIYNHGDYSNTITVTIIYILFSYTTLKDCLVLVLGFQTQVYNIQTLLRFYRFIIKFYNYFPVGLNPINGININLTFLFTPWSDERSFRYL